MWQSSMHESTTAKQIVEEKGRENLNAEDLGAIAQSMAEESGKDIQDVLTERFVELNETKQQARKDAKEIIKAVTTPSEEVTNEENDTRAQKFEANPNLPTVYAETLEGKHTAVNDALNNVQSSYHYAQMKGKRESHRCHKSSCEEYRGKTDCDRCAERFRKSCNRPYVKRYTERFIGD